MHFNSGLSDRSYWYSYQHNMQIRTYNGSAILDGIFENSIKLHSVTSAQGSSKNDQCGTSKLCANSSCHVSLENRCVRNIDYFEVTVRKISQFDLHLPNLNTHNPLCYTNVDFLFYRIDCIDIILFTPECVSISYTIGNNEAYTSCNCLCLLRLF